jgi:hypothetical protein
MHSEGLCAMRGRSSRPEVCVARWGNDPEEAIKKQGHLYTLTHTPVRMCAHTHTYTHTHTLGMFSPLAKRLILGMTK